MSNSKIIHPPRLKKGDLIGIMCPAGYMPAERASECIRVLSAGWGYRVQTGKTLGQDWHYFSGTDDERLEDLQQMLDNPEIRAVLFARGGYGVGRIIDRLDFRRFRKNPKWLIGFSDITLLHAHIHTRYHIATLHAPMAAAFNDGGFANEYVQSLHKALQGKRQVFYAAVHPFNQPGRAQGLLVGGNLALLAHCMGTRSAPDTRGKILFLEDVGEYLYNIDRMLYQLRRGGMFDKLSGLVLGGFTDNKDTERPFGKTVDEILHDLVKEFAFPVCFGFPVSHEKENYALKVGGLYTLTVTEKKVTLKEN
jgi:muramoyltetrapeptide carboxypeptidase